jgi:hypothetical protein
MERILEGFNVSNHNFIDLTGKQFERLFVIDRAGNNIDGRARWNCKCKCGTIITVLGKELRSGHTKSCGCYKRDKALITSTTHNMSHTRIFNIWSLMLSRCVGVKNKNYGGRGISVCDKWLHFDSFYKWSMNNGYSKNLSIDRIDNNGNYDPYNCRWTDRKTQANNTRRNHIISYGGETKTLAQWSDSLNIKYSILEARLNRYKWTIKRAFTFPVKII